ncbi:MAG: phosphatase PAP2 family protein [Flavobacteriales bacterium]|nr:phosphatase PAP2 family protein [Flavobacteriales bacterium]MCB9168080.1 phosphatase PAP2 family protein [Flavobacteriales bacterium]
MAKAQDAFHLDAGREAAFLGGGLLLNGATILLPVDADALWSRYKEVDRASLPAFDRAAAFRWSPRAHRASNILFFSALALGMGGSALAAGGGNVLPPLAITTESFLLSAGSTGIVKVLVHHPRPFVFDPDAPMDLRRSREAYLSFWSGHVANTASLVLSCAALVDRSDADPGTKAAVWTGGVALPLLMAWLRVRAGRHFPSDVLVGCVAGALVGLAVPYFHRPENAR